LTGAKSILVTRGAQGMALFREGKPPLSMPVFNKSEVFDVTGAGDTVVAVMTLAMVTGSTQEEAMALGNLAAGIVVRKPGTAVTSLEEMIANLEKVSL
jgi:bifunctional ADP-heptose synthase (sugar kinase/adenylyltransferase)